PAAPRRRRSVGRPLRPVRSARPRCRAAGPPGRGPPLACGVGQWSATAGPVRTGRGPGRPCPGRGGRAASEEPGRSGRGRGARTPGAVRAGRGKRGRTAPPLPRVRGVAVRCAGLRCRFRIVTPHYCKFFQILRKLASVTSPQKATTVRFRGDSRGGALDEGEP